ncbi:MAG: helix-turn-helix domain-containing protein [Verrucomicrobiota bacterium]
MIATSEVTGSRKTQTNIALAGGCSGAPSLPASVPLSESQHRTLIEALQQSQIYQDYERAFSDATGLAMTLQPVNSWQLPLYRHRNENTFCALMAGKSRSCAACLQTQQELSEKACSGTATVTCALGLSDSAVPVKLGDQVVGFLQTGQIMKRKPTEAQFDRASDQIKNWNLTFDQGELREAYFASKIVPPKQYEAVLGLLRIFAEHLSMVCNQIALQQANSEPPVIRKAKEFIHEHQAEDITLGQVAKSVNTSTFYFCKIFKKYSGLNFTDYVSRVRIEKAKNLLLNPNLRVSEIAYEVGFQSLTHFNRVFKRIVGQSPTQYREHLPTV